MSKDIDNCGTLRRSTAKKMWGAYGGHAGLTAWALVRTDGLLPVPAEVRSIGIVASAAGVALCVAGMGRFSGLAQLEGTRAQALTTRGIYRYSRNPQYLGYVVALAGAAVARRSLTAVGLTAAISFAYALWIPVEEKQLTRAYGTVYDKYRANTHRWLGMHRRR